MDEKQLDRLREIVLASGIVPEDKRTEPLDEETLLVYADKMVAKLKSLEPQAAEGAEYRTALIEEALKEGVRAHGASFNRDTYLNTLKSLPLDSIRVMRDDWKKSATAVLPGGRRSADNGDAETPKKIVSKHPAGAFKS